MTEQEHPVAPDDMTVVMPDEFAWWRRALANPGDIGRRHDLQVHDGMPNVGFYRYWSKRLDRWVAVAFFRETETGAMLAESDGQPIPDEKMGGLWLWCCRYPISYEAWLASLRGEPFHDDNPPIGIGHNLGADADIGDHERLRLEFLGERDLVESFLKAPIKTQADADRAAIWSKKLTAIKTRADEAHAVEKRPFLDGGKAVDDKWRELRDDSAVLTKRLKRAQDDYLVEQDRIEQARQRAAREEADRLAREAEIAARQAAQSQSADVLAEAGKKVAEAREAERQAAPRPVQAGRTGARTSLRTYKYALVEDWPTLALALVQRDEVRTVLQQLADKAARADVAFPGCKVVSERRTV